MSTWWVVVAPGTHGDWIASAHSGRKIAEVTYPSKPRAGQTLASVIDPTPFEQQIAERRAKKRAQ